MPAGDLLTGPDQIEWAGLLIDTHPGASGLWLHEDSRLEGWSLTFAVDDLPTAAGVSPGVPVPEAMYPMALGVCVEFDKVADLSGSMFPGEPESLAWWSRASGVRYVAEALPRRCEASTDGAQHLEWAVFDLMWLISRPLETTVYEEGS